MEEAIARLRGHTVFQDLLWVGFGYRSLVHTMATTVGGIKCIALCGCLADVHSPRSAASIMQQLWKEYEFPDQYQPSHSQLLALVSICSGAIVRTPFTQIMDIMLGDMLWKRQRDFRGMVPEASGPGDIAKALRGLFQLSKSKIDSISIVGSGECAFMAALAHWLFDFKLLVENGEGETIFSNISKAEKVQVHIQYSPQYQYSPQISSVENSAMEIRGTTYVLGDFRDALVQDRVLVESDAILCVRTEWNGCLRRAFGARAQSLMYHSDHLGTFLGSVARITAALARGESDVGKLSRAEFIDFPESCHGQGFITTVLSIFPELRSIQNLQQHMELAAETSFAQAYSTCNSTICSIRSICDCSNAHCEIRRSNPRSKLSNREFCLLDIAYTIVGITKIMACVIMDTATNRPLYPIVRGIRHFLEYSSDSEGYESRMGPSMSRMTFDRVDDDIPALILPGGLSFDVRIAKVSSLFQGSAALTWKENGNYYNPGVALAYNGVCCYIDGLRSLTCDPEAVGMVHVLSGQINYRDHPYQKMCDKVYGGDHNKETTVQLAQIMAAKTVIPKPSDEFLKLKRKWHLKVQAVAIESSIESILFCAYRVFTGQEWLDIMPGSLTRQILECSGQVACAHSSRCNELLALPSSVVYNGWRISTQWPAMNDLTFSDGTACCLWLDQDDVERCLILMNQETNGESRKHYRFLRRNECLPCCTEAAV